MCTNFGMKLLVLIKMSLSCPQLHLSLSKIGMKISNVRYKAIQRNVLFPPWRTALSSCFCSGQLTHPFWRFGGEIASGTGKVWPISSWEEFQELPRVRSPTEQVSLSVSLRKNHAGHMDIICIYMWNWSERTWALIVLAEHRVYSTAVVVAAADPVSSPADLRFIFPTLLYT